jgi:rare lipoprotein A
MRLVSLVVVCFFALSACSSIGGKSGSRSMSDGSAGMYKVGQPYTVAGEVYTPSENYSYDQTGIASWYGPGFDGKRTANGEVFDTSELTAAHPTLPMPSLVRVTNLENGRSVVVRINDRGPFAAGRIIDLSQRAAQLLGFEQNGTAKVRVTILAPESKSIADAAKKRYSAEGVQMADLMAPAEGEAQLPAVGEAPMAAPLEKVEAVALDDGPLKPSPEQPIAQPSANVVRAVELAPKIPDPKPTTVAGKTENGIFLPAPKVEHVKVTGGKRIFIQAGAFSVKENALKLKDRLSAIGPTALSEIDVNGKHFFRVRLGPIGSVKQADDMLARVLGESSNARITVE